MELRGLEPLTSAVRLQRSPRLSYSPDFLEFAVHGRDRTRTCDLYDVNVAL